MPVVQVRHFQVTIPAGTPKSAPQLTSVAFPPARVESIEWRVPRGPLGTMGWRLAMSGVVVMPVNVNSYVVADGQSGTWRPVGAPDSGDWQVQGYNTGASPHSVFLVFHTAVIEPRPALGKLLHPFELAEVPDLSHAGPPVIRPL